VCDLNWSHYSTLSVRNVSIELLTIPISDIESIDQLEEFDPGSERTLAAWLRHASRTDYA
jgi:hypothetical protein